MILKLTPKKLQKLKKEIENYKLEVPSYFACLLDEELIEIYNGAGSDQTCQAFRWIFTVMLRILKPSILIHDVDFTFKLESFEVVNERFNNNNQKLIDGKVSCWNVFYKCHIRTLKIIAKDLINAFGQKWEINK